MSIMKVIELNVAALDVRYSGLRVLDRRREAQLMASLEEHGQQDVISVIAGSEGRWVVVDGHKRVRALKRLRRDVAKAVVLDVAPADALVWAYRAGSGRGYNAIEDGWLIYELHRNAKWSLGKAAGAMGRTKSWASRRLGLVEGLPDGVLESVRRGELGAWSAMKHLLPLARANASACERLAGKIVEAGLSSRQVALVCEHYGKSGAEVRVRILEDPARFLKALEAASKGTQDPALSEAENRALKQLELVGNVALGLTRCLPQVLGYDADAACGGKLWPAWARAAKRLALLDETVAALRAARDKNKEAGYAQSGDAHGGADAAQAGSRKPEDREGFGRGAQRGEGGDRQRAGGGVAAARAAAQVGALC
jgi:ParB-like chromosome segregation protein Spo0J